MCKADYGFPAPSDAESWRQRFVELPEDVLDEIHQHAPTACPTCGGRAVPVAWAVIAAEAVMARQDYVTRIEIIGPDGREYVRYGAIVDQSYQDGNHTLKIFVSGENVASAS